MSNSSSNKASESKRPQPDPKDDTSNTDDPSDYYYDDATGYEIYEDEDDEEDEDTEPRAVVSGFNEQQSIESSLSRPLPFAVL